MFVVVECAPDAREYVGVGHDVGIDEDEHIAARVPSAPALRAEEGAPPSRMTINSSGGSSADSIAATHVASVGGESVAGTIAVRRGTGRFYGREAGASASCASVPSLTMTMLALKSLNTHTLAAASMSLAAAIRQSSLGRSVLSRKT